MKEEMEQVADAVKNAPANAAGCVAECSAKAGGGDTSGCTEECGAPEIPDALKDLPFGLSVADVTTPPDMAIPEGIEFPPAVITDQMATCVPECVQKEAEAALPDAMESLSMGMPSPALLMRVAEFASSCGLCCMANICISGVTAETALSSISQASAQAGVPFE